MTLLPYATVFASGPWGLILGYPYGVADADLLKLSVSRFASGTAQRFLQGESLDLLAPLSFRAPGAEEDLRPRAVDRKKLADALGRANVSYGHPRAAELAERLADPNTVVIATGQQAGLFGGPLFSLTKMLGAARWAQTLEQRGIPAVGVFWVATEDHDFDEIAACALSSGAELRSPRLGEDSQPLLPVGMRTLGAEVEAVLQETAALYPSELALPVIEALRSTYRPDARVGEAFCRFMCWLTGENAPLLLDSMLPALKEAEAPYMARLVESRREVGEALDLAGERTLAASLKLQVRSRADLSPLFRLQGERRCRIVWRGDDEYELRGGEQCEGARLAVGELLETLDENPSVISPGVLARPAIQDAVLGTSLQLMGPGELSYMTQAAALYPLLGIDAPATSLRPQIMVVGARSRRRLEQLGLDLEQALGPEPELDAELARRAGLDFVEQVRGRVLEEIDSLLEPSTELDSQLESPWSKTRGSVDRALELFSSKVARSAARRDDTVRQRLSGLRAECLPGGAPQERVLSTAHFVLRYGRSFASAVWEQMEVDKDRVQVIEPEGGGA